MKINNKYKWMVLSLLCFSQSLFSLDCREFECESETFAEEMFDEYIHQPLKISHTEANGIGYNSGYTTLETFLTLPDSACRTWVPFFDGRSHLSNSGKYASNTAFGVRYVDSVVWGANLVWDYRRSDRHDYNQVGLGLESLGCTWDFRINGYLPVGTIKKSEFKISHVGSTSFISEHTEFAMKGVNAEVGAEVGRICDYTLYAAIGPYYFEANKRHAFGGKSRLALQAWKYVNLEVIGSYDNLFKSIVQGRVAVNIPLPFGCPQRVYATECCSCTENLVLRKKSIEPIERFEIIVIDRKRG